MPLQPAEKYWEILPPISEDRDLDLSPVDPSFSRILAKYPRTDGARFYRILHQLISNRGLTSPQGAASFLEAEPPLEGDPSLLLGMDTAVERILGATQNGERIAVYGDYDVDGLTATVLLQDCLVRLGGQASHYIPNRFDEGYGLNSDALLALQSQGVSLVISVDCGIRSVVEALFARQIGLDLIITDHHHPGDEIPPAFAVINPRLPGDPYPDKDLTGAGIAYKLACALASRVPQVDLNPEEYLDLVALGTVADVAPLTGENRALVRRGLSVLSRSRRPGLAALQGVSGLRGKRIQSQDIGFILGPRLNAAGRLESAEAAYRLLITSDNREAGLLAQELDDQNRQRQDLTTQTQAIVESRLDEVDSILISDADESYNQGIVGLVASRLMNKYYRPVVLASRGEEITVGSCRSVPEFHIAEALDHCEDLLLRHGGHKAAAGFTVPNDRWEDLITRLEQELAARLRDLADDRSLPASLSVPELAGELLHPSLTVDAEISLSEANWALYEALQLFQPTGQKNPEPLFVTRNLQMVGATTVGKDGSHLKLKVRQDGTMYEAIAFRMGRLYGRIGPIVDLVYALDVNEYMGEIKLQLNVKDIRTAGG
jgi:single-stranded-DNA-specific exonuclease